MQIPALVWALQGRSLYQRPEEKRVILRSATRAIFGPASRRSAVIGIIERSLPAVALAIAGLFVVTAQAATLDAGTLVELQLTLKNHIDAGTVDGVYEHFNVEEGQLKELTLKNLHPKIFSKGNKYLMCADFLDADGNDVLLDYIVSKSESGFRVEQEIRGRRSYLTRIFRRIF
jgi:hypothetical protein